MSSLSFRLSQDLAVAMMYSPAGMDTALVAFTQGASASCASLRAYLTDSVILANIGDLAAAGYSAVNDPTSTESIPDYSTMMPSDRQTIFLQSQTGDVSYLTAGASTGIVPWTPTTLYLFGDYDPGRRISRFCSTFCFRISLGDSVAHATFVALKDMETFAVAASALNMNDYLLYPANWFSSGVYRDDDPAVAPPLAPQIKKVLGPIVALLYEAENPTSFAQDTQLNGLLPPVPPTPSPSSMVGANGSSPTAVVTLASGSTNKLYYVGAGAAALALLLLFSKRKKSI